MSAAAVWKWPGVIAGLTWGEPDRRKRVNKAQLLPAVWEILTSLCVGTKSEGFLLSCRVGNCESEISWKGIGKLRGVFPLRPALLLVSGSFAPRFICSDSPSAATETANMTKCQR